MSAIKGTFVNFLISLKASTEDIVGVETLTKSAPAVSRAIIWFTVALTSSVSVLVIL